MEEPKPFGSPKPNESPSPSPSPSLPPPLLHCYHPLIGLQIHPPSCSVGESSAWFNATKPTHCLYTFRCRDMHALDRMRAFDLTGISLRNPVEVLFVVFEQPLADTLGS